MAENNLKDNNMLSGLSFALIKAEDVERVAEMEKESYSEPWSRNAFNDAVNGDFHKIYCLRKDGGIIGYIGFTPVQIEAEVTNVTIDKKLRGNGYGSLLLENALQKMKEEGVVNVYLEVRVSNEAAIGLYKKHGFELLGIRRNFYRFPDEDAYVMKKRIERDN